MKLIIATFATLSALATSSFGGPLDGVWINTDSATRSIPRVEINGNQFVWWGKTHPQDSKYGPVKLTLLGDSVGDSSPDKYGYVTNDAKFADNHFVLKCIGDQLVIESLTVFKDGSKRSNYQQTLTFKKDSSTSTEKPASPPEYGIPVQGQPGFVRSPFSPDARPLDVKGIPKDTLVEDPRSGKRFRVP